MHQLTHFNKAKQELALATSIDEVKEIINKAEALRHYLKQTKDSLEMQNQCAEIKKLINTVIANEDLLGRMNITIERLRINLRK